MPKIIFMKIGFVDDHKLILEAYKSLLQDFDCTIEAFNGLEMIEKINLILQNDASKLPEIIIVNISMPIMNGFETVDWLKKNHPRIKIVISTSLSDEDSILRMIKMGVNSYLIKSELTPENFRNAIVEVIKNGNYYTSKVTELIIKSFQNSDIDFTKKKVMSLTEKERVIINLVCEELTASEIAIKLSLSNRTIDNFIQNIFSKLEVKTRVGMALFAQKNGLLN